MAEDKNKDKEKGGDKKEGGAPPPESGSKISNTEWGMAIFALLLIDLSEIGLDALFGIGAFTNPFIDLLVNMAWPTYLYLRGVNLKSAKNLATLLIGGGLQLIPGFDGFWAIEGTVIMFITKAEEKIKEKTGVDVEKIASSAEGGDVGAAAGEAGEAGSAAAEGAAGVAEGGGATGEGEEGGMSDEYADAAGQESDASDQERESDNPYGDESEDKKSDRMKDDEGDGEHDISDEDAENENKKNESQSGEGKGDKDKDKKKKKPEEKQGGRNSLFGGGGRGGGGSPDSRNKNRYRTPEEKAEDERLSFHSNLLDLSDPYAARKKKEDDERSHSE